jgi:aminoglycoside phosphotransferase family enzyme/predicted kinase
MDYPDFIKQLKKDYLFKETHIDYLLIGKDYTYKIKKTIKFPFIDYSTLAKRKHFCQEELRLNRRYSPKIYLGVVPIKNQKGKLVDYAVKMKTLPIKRSLDILIKQNKVTKKMIVALADEVWRFHQKAAKGPQIAAHGRPAYLLEVNRLLFSDIHTAGNKIIGPDLANIFKTHFDNFINQHQQLLNSRIKNRKIRDLHGDLHLGNIFYTNRPIIFDCIEFNTRYRYIDLAQEISFILMDLEAYGRPDLANTFLSRYLRNCHDYSIISLIHFYKCHYACVSGYVHNLAKKNVLARKYYKLAAQYAQPQLIAIGGVIGAGKSTLAQQLAKELGAKLLRSDEIRTDKSYSPTAIKKNYQTLLKLAADLLSKGETVILDATFSKRLYRQELQRTARQTKTNLLFIELTAPKSVLLKRLKGRQNDLSDAGPKLLNSFLKDYEPPVELSKISLLSN